MIINLDFPIRNRCKSIFCSLCCLRRLRCACRLIFGRQRKSRRLQSIGMLKLFAISLLVIVVLFLFVMGCNIIDLIGHNSSFFGQKTLCFCCNGRVFSGSNFGDLPISGLTMHQTFEDIYVGTYPILKRRRICIGFVDAEVFGVHVIKIRIHKTIHGTDAAAQNREYGKQYADELDSKYVLIVFRLCNQVPTPPSDISGLLG